MVSITPSLTSAPTPTDCHHTYSCRQGATAGFQGLLTIHRTQGIGYTLSSVYIWLLFNPLLCWIHFKKCKWFRSRNCGRLVTWFCYQLIAKPGNKTATVSWPDPNIYLYFYQLTTLRCTWSWNPSSGTARNWLSHTINMSAADDLVMQGARASVSLVLTWFSQSIQISQPGGLTKRKWFKN